MEGLVRVLANELRGRNITVNTVAPGPIPTEYAWEMLNPIDKSSVGATQVDQIPLGRSGTIEELANLTIFAFSEVCGHALKSPAMIRCSAIPDAQLLSCPI